MLSPHRIFLKAKNTFIAVNGAQTESAALLAAVTEICSYTDPPNISIIDHDYRLEAINMTPTTAVDKVTEGLLIKCFTTTSAMTKTSLQIKSKSWQP